MAADTLIIDILNSLGPVPFELDPARFIDPEQAA